MPGQRWNRYATQSFRKKEIIDDPYSMKQAPEGLLECPECRAVFLPKTIELSGDPILANPENDGCRTEETDKTRSGSPYFCLPGLPKTTRRLSGRVSHNPMAQLGSP
jgi:hypothetical protein